MKYLPQSTLSSQKPFKNICLMEWSFSPTQSWPSQAPNYIFHKNIFLNVPLETENHVCKDFLIMSSYEMHCAYSSILQYLTLWIFRKRSWSQGRYVIMDELCAYFAGWNLRIWGHWETGGVYVSPLYKVAFF